MKKQEFLLEMSKVFGRGAKLPPVISGIIGGEVKWQELEGIDFEFLGYFLSCHLIIEHYIDEFLRAKHKELNWHAARQTFSQKVGLLSNFRPAERVDFLPAIKRMNVIRNKLVHDIRVEVKLEDLDPLLDFILSVMQEETKPYASSDEAPGKTTSDARMTLLEMFTKLVCSIFLAYLAGYADATTLTVKRHQTSAK